MKKLLILLIRGAELLVLLVQLLLGLCAAVALSVQILSALLKKTPVRPATTMNGVH